MLSHKRKDKNLKKKIVDTFKSLGRRYMSTKQAIPDKSGDFYKKSHNKFSSNSGIEHPVAVAKGQTAIRLAKEHGLPWNGTNAQQGVAYGSFTHKEYYNEKKGIFSSRIGQSGCFFTSWPKPEIVNNKDFIKSQLMHPDTEKEVTAAEKENLKKQTEFLKTNRISKKQQLSKKPEELSKPEEPFDNQRSSIDD